MPALPSSTPFVTVKMEAFAGLLAKSNFRVPFEIARPFAADMVVEFWPWSVRVPYPSLLKAGPPELLPLRTPGKTSSELPISPLVGALVESLIPGAPLTVKAKSAPEVVFRPSFAGNVMVDVIPGSTCSVALVTPPSVMKPGTEAVGPAPREPALSITIIEPPGLAPGMLKPLLPAFMVLVATAPAGVVRNSTTETGPLLDVSTVNG